MKTKFIVILMFALSFAVRGQICYKEVHDTKYDWSDLAQQIAGDKTSKYDQVRYQGYLFL